nr:UDP-N-acetylmuramoyl-tripeptide--D-alanyl-D-alanine ligase [Oceanococcus sp. HetDA_MAG_MS8]
MRRAWMAEVLPRAVWVGDWPEQLQGQWCIDARQITPGDIFVALPGSKAHGHAFVEQARLNGAAAALVSYPQNDPLPQLVVPFVEYALAQLALAWRRQWSGRLLALTGSNGKTTVKEMLASIVGQHTGAVVTQGNLNNHLGVPLTLLQLNDEASVGIIEMGANHVGDIANLCRIAEPDLGIVTLAAEAHLDGFGSLDGVAQGKGEMFSSLPLDGMAIINANDRYTDFWIAQAGPRPRMLFGPGGDVYATDIRVHGAASDFELHTPQGQAAVQLPASGEHNVMNALAASAGALSLGLPLRQIVDGLQSFAPVAGRLRRLPLGPGRCLIDDSYNANPGSVLAAIAVLAGEPGPQLLCLGGMAELGADSAQQHARVGAAAAKAGLSALWTCGEAAAASADAAGDIARHFADRAQLIQALRNEAQDYQTILIKGSRSAGMDAAVSALSQENSCD